MVHRHDPPPVCVQPMSITSILALKAASIGGSAAFRKMLDPAFDWLRNQRAEAFFDQIIQELEAEQDPRWTSSTLKEALERLSCDKHAQEAMFEAGRKVSLTASGNIGPRVIAMILHPILVGAREATDDEERMFDACVALNDTDFKRMSEYVLANSSERQNRVTGALDVPIDPPTTSVSHSLAARGYINIKFRQDDYNNESGSVDRAPFNFSRDLGRWARSLSDCGLLSEISREDTIADPKAGTWGADPRGPTRLVTRHIRIHASCIVLAQHAERAIQIAGRA